MGGGVQRQPPPHVLWVEKNRPRGLKEMFSLILTKQKFDI